MLACACIASTRSKRSPSCFTMCAVQAGMDLDRDRRVIGRELRQDRRQHAGRVVVHAAEPHCALDPAALDRGQRLVVEQDQPARIGEEGLAVARDAHLPPAAVEQRRPVASSRRRICMLTADCVRLSSRAAAVKPPLSATDTKARSWSGSSARRTVAIHHHP
jgi:hypothetical protein